MHLKTYRMILTGLGNVGSSVLTMLDTQAALLREQFNVTLAIVGVAELGGAAVDPNGLDLRALIAAKQAQLNVGSLPDVGRPAMTALEVVQTVEADLLLEATPVNLVDGQPGLDLVRTALRRGMHVVLANKGPLVLAYAELAAMSDASLTARASDRPMLRFSACVGGALPTINLGLRDLAGCSIERIEGVLNGTSQSILRAMETGIEYPAALAEAQRSGMAETDPRLDVEGWDAANKLVILANAVLHRPTTLADVTVEGITQLTRADLLAAQEHGQRVVLLGLAERVGSSYTLSVRPTPLPVDHPLARMGGDEMGIVYYTNFTKRISAMSAEPDAVPAAAAMIRDVLDIIRSHAL